MSKHHRPRTCHGKRRYRDHDEALRAIRAVAKRSARQKVPVRAYDCPVCRGYHLTSRGDRYAT